MRDVAFFLQETGQITKNYFQSVEIVNDTLTYQYKTSVLDGN